jgi:RNA polymerase sigma-70 factor (ECF subfamily)
VKTLRVAPPLARRDQRSDAELLVEVGQGELAPLGELYDRYHADVWRVLHRMSEASSEVDDLVQATFLALPRLAGAYDGRASCKSWLVGIAVGLAARQRRSIGRLLRRLGAFRTIARLETVVDPEREAGSRQELEAFERALRSLPAKKREAFVLVELEGLSMTEAARALGIPPATVRTRLFHAKRALREAMKRGWE